MHGQHQVAVNIHGRSIMENRLGSLGIVACREYKSKGTNYKWEMCKAGNILSDLAQGKSVWGYLYSNEEVLSVCEKVGISPGFFSIDAGAGKHTYLLQESGKTINVDAKIKQLNDINWIEIGYKEGDTFSVYGKEYAIDSSGHINVSAEDEFTSTEIKYPSRSI